MKCVHFVIVTNNVRVMIFAKFQSINLSVYNRFNECAYFGRLTLVCFSSPDFLSNYVIFVYLNYFHTGTLTFRRRTKHKNSRCVNKHVTSIFAVASCSSSEKTTLTHTFCFASIWMRNMSTINHVFHANEEKKLIRLATG